MVWSDGCSWFFSVQRFVYLDFSPGLFFSSLAFALLVLLIGADVVWIFFFGVFRLRFLVSGQHRVVRLCRRLVGLGWSLIGD